MVSFNLPFTWRLGNEQGLRREGGSGRFLHMGGATSRSWPFFPGEAASDRSLNRV